MRVTAAAGVVLAQALACGGPAPPELAPPTAALSSGTDLHADPACAKWPLGSGCVEALAEGSDSLCALTAERAFCWGPGASPGAAPLFDPNLGHIAVLTGAERDALLEKAESPCVPAEMESVVVRCHAPSQISFHLSASPALGVQNADDLTEIVRTTENACALTKAGKVLCFGGSWSSLYGVRAPETSFSEPRQVGLDRVIDIAARGRTVCALTHRGKVFCWGGGRHFPPGALASDNTRYLAAATTSPGGLACFLGADRRVTCGRDGDYQLVPELDDIAQIASQEERICMRDGQGVVTCLERDGSIAERPFLTPAKQLTEGMPCALLADGGVHCEAWTHEMRSYPAKEIAGPGSARSVSGNCAVDTSGEVFCWGNIGMDWAPHTVMRGMQMLMLDDVVEMRRRHMPGPKDVVELHGRCARTAKGEVWIIALATRKDLAHMRLEAKTVAGADGAVGFDTTRDGCIARRADGTAFSLRADWPYVDAPFAIGPPHLEPAGDAPSDDLGVPYLAPAFSLGTHLGFRCGLRPEAGVVCRKTDGIDTLQGPPFDPLVRSTLPLRIIPR